MKTMNRCVNYLTPILLALLPAPILAATHDETDVPVQYEVVNAKLSWHLVGDTCTMTVRDLANPSVSFAVERKSDTCEVPNAKVLHGRRVKSKIQLLVRNDRGKLTVETWAITEDTSSGNPK
jgi:hypothetical protein